MALHGNVGGESHHQQHARRGVLRHENDEERADSRDLCSGKSVVDTARVQANMDAMAMQLANQTTADAAWKAIFRSSKAWAATKVAIKVNTIEPKNMARLAVVQKFCNIFAGFGVLPANIIIYDGHAFGCTESPTTPPISARPIPPRPRRRSAVYNSMLGGTTNATIPGGNLRGLQRGYRQWHDRHSHQYREQQRTRRFGGATLCMKNHFGTFTQPRRASELCIQHQQERRHSGGNADPTATLFHRLDHSKQGIQHGNAGNHAVLLDHGRVRSRG